MAPLIELDRVHYRWPGRTGFGMAVERLRIERAERVLLVGPSGTGKSTLLALIAGIVAPHAGHIRVLGEDIANMRASARDRFRAEHMGIVFQMFNLLPYGSAIDNILLPLSFAPRRRGRIGKPAAQVLEACRLLTQLGLDPASIGPRRAAELSVGQQQRVAAARALIGGPELVIADEPTSALDPDIRDKFLGLVLAEIARSGAGLLMVSHDPALSPRFDRVVHLGDVVEVLHGVAAGTRAAPETAV
ncbi:MAG: ATP-binding cassette domain-containing protein [Hyphomicrobiaceae bacterium]|nr:ATP-binding cassette domain-containing protein [Hyphomicrobiaceae bacterium]